MTEYQPMSYYLSLPWSFDVEFIADPYHGENWTVFVKELPGCKTHGETPTEAMANIHEAIESHLAALMAIKEPIPEPVTPEAFKGVITYRTNPDTHYRLAKVAQRRKIG